MTKHDFKRKRYGMGWIPVTAVGWLQVLVYLVAVIGTAIILLGGAQEDEFSPEVIIFLLLVVVYTVILVFAGKNRRPRMKWRWGKKDTDNPSEDF